MTVNEHPVIVRAKLTLNILECCSRLVFHSRYPEGLLGTESRQYRVLVMTRVPPCEK